MASRRASGRRARVRVSRLLGAPGGGPAAAPAAWWPLAAALVVGLGYYAGARIGLALTYMPFPLAVLWPPNALLLAALALAPVRWWWALLLGALAAHLLAELGAHIPLATVLGWFASNVCEALVGALIVRRFCDPWSGLRSVRSVLAFAAAALVAALLSSFLDAAFVRLTGWSDAGYWSLWGARSLSSVVATLTFVPLILGWATAAPASTASAGPGRLFEAVALLAGLLVVGTVVFDAGMAAHDGGPGLLYLPIPFLLWAALRFGPPLSSTAFAIVAFLAIWGAGHGHGPFQPATAHSGALPVQLFLVMIAAPLLLLAALIEERRLAVRELGRSQALFATAFHSGPDAIAIIRRSDAQVIEANERWRELLGPQGAANAPETVAALLGGGDARDVEIALQDGRGRVHQALVTITALELQGPDCVLGVIRDISAQRRAEGLAHEEHQQLIHLSRVASLTAFSSTLAHELNQPLTAILSNAQAALRLMARDPPNVAETREILQEIVDADKRAGRLIHHLRLLMKRGSEEFVWVDLNPLVTDTLKFVGSEFLARNISVASNLSPDLPQVHGDPVQLQQLLLNLISNGCEAMQGLPPGRRRQLSVTTLQASDGGVQLVVADTGCGITAERMALIFEPLFTTKPDGLGFGLPICRTIAQAHGGTLSAENRHDGGASLRLQLPAQAAQQRRA
jgi:signal transduction histidine kinase